MNTKNPNGQKLTHQHLPQDETTTMLYSSQRKATVHKATKVHTHHFTNKGVTQVTATMLENTDIPKKYNASGTLKRYRAHFTKVQHTSQTVHFEYLFAQWASTLVNKIPKSSQVP